MFCAQRWWMFSNGLGGLRFAVVAVAILLVSRTAAAQSPPLGGFIPFVGIGMTDEAKTIDSLDLGDIPFIAEPASTLGAPLLGAGGSPHFEIALLDTGAATHIITQEAFAGFGIDQAGLRGTNTQVIGGATGQLLLEINDAAGIYTAGLGDRTAAGSSLSIDTAKLRGQTSFATLTAPAEWTLPNILGLPMAAQHAISIRNDDPQIFELNGRTVRTPQVELMDLGVGDQQGITRRAPLLLRPGIGFVQGPQFVFNLDLNDILIGGGDIDIANNPSSPSVIIDSSSNGGGLFIEVDLQNGADGLQDTEFFFDTGASLTVVSEQTAVRLGFDPVLDTPDFELQVEGSGGVSSGIPGFYLDELKIDTIGGGFAVQNVPIAVLDVTNPNDPGNIVPGILGTNVFNGRNLVIDANASIGQGGTGPSLYISDPVTETRTWTSPVFQASFQQATSWSAPGVPDELWSADLRNELLDLQFVNLNGDSTVFELVVAAPGGRQVDLQILANDTLTTFGETRLEAGGHLVLIDGKLDAAVLNIDGGVLRGRGDVFVGNGPITGQVRNLTGRIEVGSFGDGELAIDGDLSNLDGGTILFEIDSNSSPLLSATRFAFLDGTLEVGLLGNPDLMVGDAFTLITAGEAVEGQFDNLLLPAGFEWDVLYNANSVVLEVLGIGVAGDLNGDSLVTAADYAVWRSGAADANGYEQWKAGFGSTQPSIEASAVPEPSSLLLVLAALGSVIRRGYRGRSEI